MRYSEGQSFRSVLYPLYHEFIKRLREHKQVIANDVIPHTKVDGPARQRITKDVNDFVDKIELFDIKFSITQIKTCLYGN
jgi:hypothetical protein